MGVVDCLCHLGVLPMKLIFGIALVLGLMMLGEGIALGVMIALLIAFAVRLALPF